MFKETIEIRVGDAFELPNGCFAKVFKIEGGGVFYTLHRTSEFLELISKNRPKDFHWIVGNKLIEKWERVGKWKNKPFLRFWNISYISTNRTDYL
jgi:hypothetical protein